MMLWDNECLVRSYTALVLFRLELFCLERIRLVPVDAISRAIDWRKSLSTAG